MLEALIRMTQAVSMALPSGGLHGLQLHPHAQRLMALPALAGAAAQAAGSLVFACACKPCLDNASDTLSPCLY